MSTFETHQALTQPLVNPLLPHSVVNLLGAPFCQADQANLGSLSNPAGKNKYDKLNTQFCTVVCMIPHH